MSRAVPGGLALALAVASWSPAAVAAAQPVGEPPADVVGASASPPDAVDEAPVAESPGPRDAAVTGDPEIVDDPTAAEDSEFAGDPTEPGPAVEASPPASEPSAATPSPSPEPDTHDVPADDYEREAGLAPGGYYGHGVILDRPPPNGHQQIVLGSILVPLGIIAAVSSGVGTWMSVPSHCVERMAAIGTQIDDPSRCQGWFVYNAINTTYGALMLTSGAVILGIGLVKRQRYRAWRAKHGMRAWLRPGRRSAAVGLALRF